MDIIARGVVLGMTYSKGEYEGRAYDKATLFAQVDLSKEKSNGKSVGYVVKPYSLGTSADYEKATSNGQVYPALCEMVISEESTGGRNDDGSLRVVHVIKELKYINAVGVIEQPKKAA